MHRVGRTARAGRSGKSITFVTQYDVEWYQRIEHAISKKLDPYPIPDKGDVMLLKERVDEAVRFAHMQMKEDAANGRGGKRNRDGPSDDAKVSAGKPRHNNNKKKRSA